MGRLEWNQKEHDLGLNTHFNTYRMTLVKSINLSKILTPTKMEKVICALWFDMEVNTYVISPGNTISTPLFTLFPDSDSYTQSLCKEPGSETGQRSQDPNHCGRKKNNLT